jgi:hypothetical protein
MGELPVERGGKVCGKVVDMFDADREAYEARADARDPPCLLAHCGVGHGGGMRDEAFDAAEGLGEGEAG